MSDPFYRTIRFFGRFPFWVSTSPTVRGLENIPEGGPYIVAGTHHSAYDIPLLIRHVPRLIDIVSTTEIFARPFFGWFYGNLNGFPLDRFRADPHTVRGILSRLERGRVVAMFPEGRLNTGLDSVIHNGRIRPGIGRVAAIANVPVVPCVILNSSVFSKATSWLPLRRTRYSIAFGKPLLQPMEPKALEEALVESFRVEARGLPGFV